MARTHADPAFDRMMAQVAWITPATGSDIYGQQTFGVARRVKCRVQPRRSQGETPQGSEKASYNAIIYLLDDAVKEGDKVLVEGMTQTDGTQLEYRVDRVDTMWDERGPYYQMVYVS